MQKNFAQIRVLKRRPIRGKFLCDVCAAYYALPISALDLVHVNFGHDAGCRSLIRQISIGFHRCRSHWVEFC